MDVANRIKMTPLYRFVLIAIILPTVCEAINCIVCQQLAGPNCQDPFPQEGVGMYESDCGDMVCVKMTTVVKIRDSGYIQGWERHSKVVSRYCEAKSGKLDGCTGWQNNGGITIKCYCSTDDCNSGRSLSPSAVPIILVAVFLCFFLRNHWFS